MAIFGDLLELQLPELLNLVGRRTGKLELLEVGKFKRVELHISTQCLKGIVIGDELLDDALLVRDKLASVMNETSGTFEFHKVPEIALRGSLSISIPQLLLSIASTIDEIDAYRKSFSHPNTIYKCLTPCEVWLDEDLYLFFEKAQPYLNSGVDAQVLANKLDLSLDQIQLYLYKLRSVGKVSPIRAFEVEITKTSTYTQERPLNKTYLDSSVTRVNPNIVSNIVPNTSFDLSFTNNEKKTGLISKMLSALKKSFW